MSLFAQIFLAVFATVSFHFQAYDQTYIQGGNTRHRFAQLNLGADIRIFPNNAASSNRLLADNTLQSFRPATMSDIRFIIGGTHFWGHADFYIAIPITAFSRSEFSTGVETGGKFFPWRIKHNKLRPFIGAAFMPVNFQQGDGAIQNRFRYPLTAGCIFNYRNLLFELGTGFIANNRQTYFISPTVSTTIHTPMLWASIGCKWMLETTLSSEKDWINGRTQRLTDTLAKMKQLNGLTVAAGISAAFYTRSSPHNSIALPFIDQHKSSGIFADLGIGYYFHSPDIQINLAFRHNKSKIGAYGFSQNVKRTALSLEAFKFLGDYHGFAPFIGPAIGYEFLKVNESGSGAVSAVKEMIRPGLTFGWDIRPTRLQAFYLRTNLRYFPNLGLSVSGQKMWLDQLEFNFIQLVVFPGRMFGTRRY